jgi:hypothetical protein
MVAALHGELDVNLVGRIDSHNGGIRTTFASVPDAPVTRFDLRLDGGAKGVLEVVRGADLCRSTQLAAMAADGQSGRTRDAELVVGTSCRLAVIRSSATRTGLRLTVGGLGTGGGKVTVSGRGLRTTTRTVKAATTVTVSVPFSRAGRTLLAGQRKATFPVKVRFAPKTGKATTVTKRVTVRGTRR